MSYHFAVRAEGGKLSIDEGAHATVPDGVFSISGHENEHYVTIGVTRYEQAGNSYSQVMIVQEMGQAKRG